MIGTIPIGDEAQRARVDKLKAMTPAKIAPLAVALASEAGKQVSGQIFAVRNNEIFLMGQSRPVRSVHTAEGWTPEGWSTPSSRRCRRASSRSIAAPTSSPGIRSKRSRAETRQWPLITTS